MTLLPQLLTEAAHGGLKPSPTGWLRRVLLHLSYSMALSRLLDTTLPRLLTVAACGGLEPAPDSRLRGAFPHLLHGIAPPSVRSWHTIVGIGHDRVWSRRLVALAVPAEVYGKDAMPPGEVFCLRGKERAIAGRTVHKVAGQSRRPCCVRP